MISGNRTTSAKRDAALSRSFACRHPDCCQNPIVQRTVAAPLRRFQPAPGRRERDVLIQSSSMLSILLRSAIRSDVQGNEDERKGLGWLGQYIGVFESLGLTLGNPLNRLVRDRGTSIINAAALLGSVHTSHHDHFLIIWESHPPYPSRTTRPRAYGLRTDEKSTNHMSNWEPTRYQTGTLQRPLLSLFLPFLFSVVSPM